MINTNHIVFYPIFINLMYILRDSKQIAYVLFLPSTFDGCDFEQLAKAKEKLY